MCGIAGIIGTIDEHKKEALKKMAEAFAHRGPDGSGVWHTETVGLSHRRLAIFDLTQQGAQPMVSPCGRYVICYNGEVYNWYEIRPQLSFQNWRSRTDTETILHAYMEQGPECLQMFNGMFGLAIWDGVKNHLFLARDRVGIKPLFYGFYNNELYFSSEPKAMFAAGFPKKPDYRTLYDFLRWGLVDHDEKSFFENIYSVNPGSYLIYEPGGKLTEKQYWNLGEIISNKPLIGPEEAIERYSELLKDSVRLRIRADVTLGSMLSGGIDSSVLTCYLHDFMGDGKPASFTYDYELQKGEATRARQVSDALDIPWNLVTLSLKEVPEALKRVIRFHESPITSMVILARHKIYEEARRQGYIILIEGHGGDELGAGYHYYSAAYIMDILKKANGTDTLPLIKGFLSGYNIPEEQHFLRFIENVQSSLRPGTATHDGVPFVSLPCLGPSFLDQFKDKEPALQKLTSSYLDNVQYMDYRHVLLPRALRYSDRASMASSMEARVPILDHRIVEMSFQTSVEARINRFQQRYFMCRSAERYLPKRILERPKVPIVDPQREWLQDALRPWITELFHSKDMEQLDILNQKEVLKEYKRFCSVPSPRSSFHIFQYVNVLLWFKEMFDHG
ncbi:MAG: asparagine synthase (glutamine-hydrolyzing) [Candidatus Aureabacteria bacterium]|nr:asparagine synthase (glutamine-hydrolyzing) [Candidatus Auribacterota bacterium]